jgi:ABC-2 type transport system permease protein
VNGPIYRLTMRQLLRGKRPIALSLVPLVPALLALAYAADGTATRQDAYSSVVGQLLIPSAASFVALVLGASALGDERDDGTILYLASTPLSRLSIAVAKLAAAWTGTMLLCVPGLLLCTWLTMGFDGSATAWGLLALASTTLAYCAVFSLLALLIRRPVVVGFLYILFWEGSIAAVATSADKLSIAAYGRVAVAQAAPDASPFNAPDVSGLFALVLLAVVTVAAAWLGGWRLARVELP